MLDPEGKTGWVVDYMDPNSYQQMGGGAYFMVTVLGLLAFLAVIGMIVQYTPLCRRKADEDAPIEKQKTKLG